MGGPLGGGGCQGGCEWRSEAFVKIKKKKKFRGGGRVGSQGGWERRSEACVKIKKKWGGVGWGVRVDVNGEVKLL